MPFTNPIDCEYGDSCSPGCIGCRRSDACFCPFCAPFVWGIEDDADKLESQSNRGIITVREAQDRILERAVVNSLPR